MGQGPQGMIMAAIMQHRQAAIFCAENGLLKLGCTFIRAMGSALPKEAEYKIIKAPTRKQGINETEWRTELENWIDKELIRVEDAIADYVKKFFERGGNRLD